MQITCRLLAASILLSFLGTVISGASNLWGNEPRTCSLAAADHRPKPTIECIPVSNVVYPCEYLEFICNVFLPMVFAESFVFDSYKS